MRSAGAWSQQAYLKASNTEANDRFGWSVAISGNTIVVGATYEDSNATGVNGNQSDNSAHTSGAAYVFVRSAGAWSQQAYLKASNTGADDNFGESVAISGDTLVVGAYDEASNATGVNGNQSDNSAPNSGAAYVFVRSVGAWSQQAYLKASNTGATDFFGASVAISGNTLVVGAYGEDSDTTGVNGDQSDNSAPNSGAAYVFVRSAGAWSLQAYLKASNTGAGDVFGASVAISGATLVVGANGEDSNATGVGGDPSNNSANSSGAAYVFVRSAGAWSQQAYLKASNTGTADQFGQSVAISGDTLVVGADGEDSNATGVDGDQSNNSASFSGAAYVFVRSAGAWSQQAYLKASNTGAIDQFGQSVAISGDTLVVGANGEDSNATGVDGDQSNNSASSSGAAYVFGPAADLEMAKAADVSYPDPGDTVVFTLTVTNQGPEGAPGVTVTDTLPAGLTYVSNDCGAAFASPTLTWTIGTLANLASATCHLTVTVDAGAGAGTSGTIVNTAAVASNEFDPQIDDNDASATLTVTADLSIQKAADNGSPAPGGAVVFTLAVTNQGPSGATGVTITDTLPAGLTYVSNDCGAAFASPTLTWTIGALANLASATCHLTVTVDAGASGTITNTAAVAGNEFDPQIDDNDHDATLTVIVADLEIQKTVDNAAPAPGDTLVFTLTSTNQGPAGATGVAVTDTLPAGLTYVSNDCGAAFASPTLTWSIGALANLASATCHLTVTVDAGASGTIVNTASVDGNEFDPQIDDNDDDATLTVTVADLEMAKAADVSDPDPGDTVVFTLTVTNQGPSGATGVTVTDTLPAGLTYGSNDCGATFASPTLTWTIGALANLASATCHLTVTVDAGASGTIINTAAVDGDEFDPQIDDNDDDATLTVTVADLEMAKAADISDPDPGDTVVFTLTVTNQGPDGATGVAVTDTLPAGLTYGSNDCGAAFASPTLTWSIGALANLASATCHLTVTVDAGASGTIVNTAAVDGNEFDPQIDDNDDGATLTVTVADLEMAKAADVSDPNPGDTVVFTLTVTNQGPSDATGVVVTDTLPAGLTYGSNDCGAAFASPTLTWSIGALANLASATCHLTVTVDAGASGTIVNTAAVDGNEFDPQIADNDDGATLIVDPTGYYTVTPCRLVDTRLASGPLGGPALAANVARGFVLAGACGVPADAVAVVLTVTAVGPTAAGGLQIYPAGSTPFADGGTVHYGAGLTRAGNGVVALGGAGGAVSALAEQPAGTVHLILDVAGYFLAE